MKNLVIILSLLCLLIYENLISQTYTLDNSTIEILSLPSPVNGEYFSPDYNSILKPLIAQPFSNNAKCFQLASEILLTAGNVSDVFFGGDRPSIHGYSDLSTQILTKEIYKKSDFPILLESNFFSRESDADYNEFYFWIGDAFSNYFCAATTVLPFDNISTEGVLVGGAPNKSFIFNGFDNQTSGQILFNENNSFFTTKKWSNQKVLLDVVNEKLAIIGFWIDGNCVYNAFESGYVFIEGTPWLDNYRLGVCIDDLVQGFKIERNYNYLEVLSPSSLCETDCSEFEIIIDDLFCKDNLNLTWTFEGATITTANTALVSDVCYPNEGVFDYQIQSNGISLGTGSVNVTACTQQNLDNVLVLDGCTNYYEINENNLLDYNGNLSIEAWIKPNCSDGNRMIVAKEWCNGNDFSYYLSVNEGKLHWQFDDDGDCTPTYTFTTLSSEIPTDKFTHVAMVHSANDIKLFINGKIVASQYVNGTFSAIHNSSEPLRIGVYKGLTGNLGNYFSGAIDELRVWNISLSQTDILNRMNKKLSGQENGLVAYFDMAENGIGTLLPLVNKSKYGSVFNATPHGFTLNTPYIVNWNEYVQDDFILQEDVISCLEEIKLEIPEKMYKKVLWSTGESSTSILVSNPGIYSIELETEMCRIFKDTFNIVHGENITTDVKYEICEGESVLIGNELYYDSGQYSQTIKNLNGCDSIINLDLKVGKVDEFYTNIQLCHGDSTLFFGNWYKESGVYFQTYINAKGCDSTYRVNVEIKPDNLQTQHFEICDGESITIGPIKYYAEGEYTANLLTTEGCDSLIKFTITHKNVNADFEYSYNYCNKTLALLPEQNAEGRYIIKKNGIIYLESTANQMSLNSGLYEVTYIVNDSTICRKESTKLLDVESPASIEDISLPNIIAPDRPGNDEFCISNSLGNQFVFNRLKIYDRFGNLVFNSSTADECWDGRFKGKNCETGVYTIITEVSRLGCQNEKYSIFGDITILK